MRLPAARALEAIRGGKISPGYILLGKEVYWRDRIYHALRQAAGLEPAAMGIAEFDIRQDSVEKVLEGARSRNLLVPRQLLMVRNAQTLASRQPRGRKGRAEAGARQPDELSAYFRRPNPDSIIVLEMMDVDLNSDDWREREKVQSRLETFGGIADVVLLAAPGLAEALQLIREEAKSLGRTISPEAAERLAATFDCDMGRIRMELEKLSAFNPDRETIEPEDLQPASGGFTAGSDLLLTEAIGAADPERALAALQGIEQSRRYPPLVLLEVARYLRQLILLRENQVREPRQAAKLLWSSRLPAPQGSMPRLIEQARRAKGRMLLKGLRLAYEAEIALRSNPPDDWVILERFVLKTIGLPRTAPED